jgi:hypothetical protein
MAIHVTLDAGEYLGYKCMGETRTRQWPNRPLTTKYQNMHSGDEEELTVTMTKTDVTLASVRETLRERMCNTPYDETRFCITVSPCCELESSETTDPLSK